MKNEALKIYTGEELRNSLMDYQQFTIAISNATELVRTLNHYNRDLYERGVKGHLTANYRSIEVLCKLILAGSTADAFTRPLFTQKVHTAWRIWMQRYSAHCKVRDLTICIKQLRSLSDDGPHGNAIRRAVYKSTDALNDTVHLLKTSHLTR